MKTSTLVSSLLFAGANVVLADKPLPLSAFTDNDGLAAAMAAAPMWHMPKGTCMPSAAEDGQGHQTDGVGADNCNIFKLDSGCPKAPAWQGQNTYYGDVAGEPFAAIPTYWQAKQCDEEWKIIYYVYFKKDTGHKSDWEGIVVAFNSTDGGQNFTRNYLKMEQDGKHPWVNWGDINDTFDGNDDKLQFMQKNKDHPKVYFGKFHHSVHTDWHTNTFKNTCPPNSVNDYRNADYQFWSQTNLRPVSVLDPNWDWGPADSPANQDICNF